ncbi:MAG: outer membrane protein assembly factor BamD [Deltaproteobacteria bacterium]|nr:outer membrane protein assembly factor BamD [Deltaproteobacteria bacterium]
MNKFRIVIICVLFAVGCATTGAVKSESESAKEEFEDAIKSLKGGYYQEAIDKFSQIKAKYPFSKYATEAELKIGDTYFEDEKYSDAADAYQEFIKLHPTHPMTDYAAFRVALSYYKDAPGDWFFMPPSYEKDQTSNLKAQQAFNDFLARYKGSQYEKEAREYLEKVNLKLIHHDLYIARFYFKRNKFEATEHRIKGIIQKYGITEGMDEVLYLLCYSLFLQNKDDEFRKMLEVMNSRFPKSRYLQKLHNLSKPKGKG